MLEDRPASNKFRQVELKVGDEQSGNGRSLRPHKATPSGAGNDPVENTVIAGLLRNNLSRAWADREK